MKKIIASALAVLLGSLGFVVVDNTIEQRVATLESQVISLSAEKENTSSDKIYKIGDKIPCFPEAPYSFDSVVGYGDEITVYIDSFTAEIIGIDEVNTEGETITTSYSIIPNVELGEETTKKPTTVKYGEYNIYRQDYIVEINISGRIANLDDFLPSEISVTYTNYNGVNYGSKAAVNSDGSFTITSAQSFLDLPDKFELSNIDLIGFNK